MILAGRNKKIRQIMFSSFFGGLAWGLGSVIGATIILALLIGILNFLNRVPIIGSFTNLISNTIQKDIPRTGK